MKKCNQNCNQGRACDCGDVPSTDPLDLAFLVFVSIGALGWIACGVLLWRML